MSILIAYLHTFGFRLKNYEAPVPWVATGRYDRELYVTNYNGGIKIDEDKESVRFPIVL